MSQTKLCIFSLALFALFLSFCNESSSYFFIGCDWRDLSAVKSVYCSFRELALDTKTNIR